MFPRGIPSAALPAQSQVPSGLCSSRASRKLGSLSLASSDHHMPHGQPGGGTRPPGSAPLHRLPARRPPPCRRSFDSGWPPPALTPSGHVAFAPVQNPYKPSGFLRPGLRHRVSCLTPCLRPPRFPPRRCKKALRVRRSCRPHRTLARPPPGANGVK